MSPGSTFAIAPVDRTTAYQLKKVRRSRRVQATRRCAAATALDGLMASTPAVAARHACRSIGRAKPLKHHRHRWGNAESAIDNLGGSDKP